jgi:Kef-type K+ transport system membrane component KefB
MTLIATGGLSSEQLLTFWTSLTALLVVAHLLGALSRRFGQPSVVGELVAGIMLGPSLFGRVLPEAHAWMFGDDPVQNGLLLAVSWIGVLLLMTVTGFETDFKLLRRLGRASAAVSAGSLLVPLAGGVVLGMMLPQSFIGPAGSGASFILFVAVALSISALPVIAKVLFDLQLMRRDLGQITIAAGMTNDLIGWLLLGIVAGLASTEGFSATTLLPSLGGLAIFLVLAFTLGQRLVDRLLRRVRETSSRHSSLLATLVVVTLGAGVVTQWLGVEAVLGAFIAGIVLGQSRYADPHAEDVLERVTQGFFAPIFFATAGLSVDLGLLLTPAAGLWTLVIIVMAVVTKVAGAFIGGRIGGLSAVHSGALGAALNARGAFGLVIATIGLDLAVLNDTSYAAVVVMAMVTSMIAGPALMAILRGEHIGGDESARLAREELLAGSVAGASSALLPTRGGTNSIAMARIVDSMLQPEAFVTMLTVHRSTDVAGEREGATAARALSTLFTGRNVEWIDRVDDDTATAILNEARLGYGLMALGMTHGERGGTLSRTLERVLAASPVPVLLISQGPGAVSFEPHIRRILVSAITTRVGRAAQDVAFVLAERLDADVDAVHVVTTPEPVGIGPSDPASSLSGEELLADTADIAASFGRTAALYRAHGNMPAQQLLDHAERSGADLIVAGVDLSTSDDRAFLGYDAEYLLKHARQTVALVIFPT